MWDEKLFPKQTFLIVLPKVTSLQHHELLGQNVAACFVLRFIAYLGNIESWADKKPHSSWSCDYEVISHPGTAFDTSDSALDHGGKQPEKIQGPDCSSEPKAGREYSTISGGDERCVRSEKTSGATVRTKFRAN